jgi:hypothetical protein
MFTVNEVVMCESFYILTILKVLAMNWFHIWQVLSEQNLENLFNWRSPVLDPVCCNMLVHPPCCYNWLFEIKKC